MVTVATSSGFEVANAAFSWLRPTIKRAMSSLYKDAVWRCGRLHEAHLVEWNSVHQHNQYTLT